jgi:hypothetical protein
MSTVHELLHKAQESMDAGYFAHPHAQASHYSAARINLRAAINKLDAGEAYVKPPEPLEVLREQLEALAAHSGAITSGRARVALDALEKLEAGK